MKEKFLPIGSIVTLKEATKRIMIIGYLPIKDDGVLYDYSACVFPEGILDTNKMLMFNHKQIDKINYLGLEDEEYTNFNNVIKEEYGFNKNKNTISKKDNSKAETLYFN